MKRKISRILGVALVVTLVATLMIAAAPVSASVLKFGAETIPSTTGKIIDPTYGNITDMAVASDGTTIYITNGTTTMYKSTDGGWTWAAITTAVAADLVAVAPDDPDLVVYANAATPKLYVSANGGTTFSDLTAGIAVVNIFCIDVSPASAGVHYIAVGGDDGAGAIEVSYWNYGSSVPTWTDASAWVGLDGTVATRAFQWSPAFASDKVFLIVTELGTGSVLLEIGSVARKKFNDDAGFAGYSVAIATSPVVAPLESASLSMDPGYLGADETTRKCIVGLSLNAGETAVPALVGGIFRFSNTTKKEIKETTPIGSVAFDGEKVVAGNWDNNTVYRSADPFATSPTVSATTTYQKPGGVGMTTVAWADSTVIAGTRGNESCIAISNNDGKDFNDVSQVRSQLTNIEDIAISDDGGTFYLLADDGADLSLWRKASSWERVLNVIADINYIVRIAPEDPTVVYLGEIGQDTCFYSNESGESKWVTRSCNVNIADMAVESADVVYAVDAAGDVTKTTNAGFIWGTKKASKVLGNTIVSLGEDKVIVGGINGFVSYCDDGDVSTWTKLSKAIGEGAASNVQVAASGLADDDFIYAAGNKAVVDNYIYRWEIGTSTDWTQIYATADNAAGVQWGYSGLVLKDGVLYASKVHTDATPVASKIQRTIEPSKTTAAPTWSAIASTSLFNAAPRALKVTSGSFKLWLIDAIAAAADKVYSYSDTLSVAGPTITSPTDVGVVTTTPIIRWDKIPDVPTGVAVTYSWRLALDKDYLDIVDNAAGIAARFDRPAGLAAGTKYYWQVWVDAPILSPKSARSFSTKLGNVALTAPDSGREAALLRPSFAWLAVAGATGYEFELGTNADPDPWGYFLSGVIIRKTGDAALEANVWECDRDLEYGQTYYWHVRAITSDTKGNWANNVITVRQAPVTPPPPVVVKETPAPVITVTPNVVIPPAPAPITPAFIWAIVIIGGVLVIAVIVLIVRTRRVS